MTLFEHLEELRKRVFRCTIWLLLGIGLAYAFQGEIWSVVVLPVHEALLKVGGKLQVTELSAGFFVTFKLCAIVGLFLASPLLFWEVWGFVSRGLHEREKRPVRIYVPFAAFLFAEGCVFYYFVIQPSTLEFLTSFLQSVPLAGGGAIRIEQNIQMGDAVAFFLGMSLVMGLVFELPLVMLFVQKLGIASWKTFSQYRRHFLMASLVAMAVLTPSGDWFTLALCMIPVVVLFEGGILVCRLTAPKDLE